MSTLPLNVFEPFDAKWRRTYIDRWEVQVRGDLLVNCPHGWSLQPRDLRPDEALVAHQGICIECKESHE